MITVRLPSMLRRPDTPAEVFIDVPVATIAELINVLDQRVPGIAAEVEDTLYNFAVNDLMILHRAREHPLAPNDVVEIIPTISGGTDDRPRARRR